MTAVADRPSSWDTWDDPGDPGGRGETALSVDTIVFETHGRWAVDIVVLFRDSVVRRRITTYSTRRVAEISARLIRRGADRDPEGRQNG